MRSTIVASTVLLGTALAQSQEPCAVASAQVAQYSGSIEPETAWQCLQSVPVATQDDMLQLTGMLSFNNFQSTLAYLKDPTPGYLYPAVDILGGLQDIQNKLQNNGYDNEYDVQNAIFTLIMSAHDGHFVFNSDIVASVVYFTRGISLVSLSTDGVSVPKIYATADLAVLAGSSNADYTPSAITQINGVDVDTWLGELANATSSNQDPDAAFNYVLYTPPGADSNVATPFQQGFVYSGNSTSFTFGNGSTGSIPNGAVSEADWSGVTDGQSFYDTFCKGNIPTPGASSGSASASATAAPSSSAADRKRSPQGTSSGPVTSSAVSGQSQAPAQTTYNIPNLSSEVSYAPVAQQTSFPGQQGYPQPYAIAADLSIACYFPQQNPDLAVLACPNFEPQNKVDFSDVIRECLATAEKLGKEKLIIDLRQNPGGDVLCAYDWFKQLFPSITPWGTSNFRAWQLFDQMGEIVTNYYSDVTTSDATQQDLNGDFETVFNAKQQLNESLQPFANWEAFYGPVSVHNDNFTELTRWNLDNQLQVGQPISGYGNLTDIVPKQTFQSSDILLVQDGNCASTCAVFSEFMKSQGNVTTVVFGGRQQTGPMQGVGGVKGANEYPVGGLLAYAQAAFQVAPSSEGSSLNNQYGDIVDGIEQALKRVANGGSSAGGPEWHVNARNNIREGDETLTPLQFVYEAANCRLFYTAQQILNQALVWKAAYAAKWSGAQCVDGSTDQDSSEAGTSFILATPGATQAPSTPKTAIATQTSHNVAAYPLATGAFAAMVTMVPAIAGAVLLL